ncbi:carbonic anhydrase family protein [Candidatus Nitrotoga fabula]|uniref:Carbonic anhydrase n=1 Tax=Candidatus Nitrotoga fabula TaxID=2182327 RepID=A0A916BBV7_9PROT|nr:carbonic anhydrase family protein [Candidatus Nitrotoga fabula]CAE6709673.1 Carbonic anhydrase [Candidatus Nitrotoga fabula]
MRTHTKETQANLTPEMALQILKEGNARFAQNVNMNRDLLQQLSETSEGQFPFAVILSCIDSRTSAELIFDQGLGDLFSIRIAGNIADEDILGSMEFACKVAGAKIIVVLGHTGCGAIKSACDNIQFGNFTALVKKLRIAVARVRDPATNRNSQNSEFVENVARENVFETITHIKHKSEVLRGMLENFQIAIVGGMYDTQTGLVDFYQ